LHINKIIVFLLIILSCISFSSNAQMQVNDQEYFEIEDISKDWFVYSRERQLFVPYISSINKITNNIYLNLDPDLYSGKNLYIYLPPMAGLFIDNKLVEYSDDGNSFVYSIDSLKAISGQENLFVSIHSSGTVEDIQTKIISNQKKNPLNLIESRFFNVEPVNRIVIWDFIKISVLLILIFYIILINFGNRVFLSYYNIMNTFTRASADEFLSRSRKLNRIDTMFIFVLALVISLILVLIYYRLDPVKGYGDISSILSPFLLWGIIFILVLAWIIFRFFIISLSSTLFNVRELNSIHTFEYLRITNFYGLSIVIILILLLFVVQIELALFSSFLIYSLIFISIFRAVILFYKFLNSSHFTKLYLFAYLCIAELIPMFIGLKWILKSNLLDFIS